MLSRSKIENLERIPGLATPDDVRELIAMLREVQKDAARYQILRDSKYQINEDDPCVSDSSFETYFETELDDAVDKLKARFDAAMRRDCDGSIEL